MGYLGSGLNSVLMRVSRKYHARVVRQYWDRTEYTHTDMTSEAFDFYATRIADLLGKPAECGIVLDHGAGEGSIGMKLAAKGYNVEFSEFAPQFIQRINSLGYRCHPSSVLPENYFDTIFSNSALYFVHPSLLMGEIRRLMQALRPGGRLLVLDVPTLQRERYLGSKAVVRFVRHVTGVWQPQAGGFFIDEKRIVRAFPGTRVKPSWTDYTAHFELRR